MSYLYNHLVTINELLTTQIIVKLEPKWKENNALHQVTPFSTSFFSNALINFFHLSFCNKFCVTKLSLHLLCNYEFDLIV